MIKTRVSFITSILKFQNCRQNWIYGKQLRNLTLSDYEEDNSEREKRGTVEFNNNFGRS